MLYIGEAFMNAQLEESIGTQYAIIYYYYSINIKSCCFFKFIYIGIRLFIHPNFTDNSKDVSIES